MGRALYRKYRPKKIADVIGQPHITKTLENALQTKKISHAYLLTGPKGVGKTSVARILAHEINSIPYSETENHIDIIEIDAASNRRIDEIRDLRAKVHITPTSAKYKVYIIDEVHMLTKEAFNALLKTLEEPPSHVVFVLATTEFHKLPETIVSRTQHFPFKPILPELVAKHLEKIAKQEKVSIEPEALSIIADYGKGSFRDSISLFDQLSSSDETIKAEDVLRTIGAPSKDLSKDIIEYVDVGDIPKLVSILSNMYSQGLSAGQTAIELSNELRDRAMTGANNGDYVLKLAKSLLDVPGSLYPTATLEIALLSAAVERSKQELDRGEITQKSAVRKDKIENDLYKNPKKVLKNNERGQHSIWQQVLHELKGSSNTLYGIARMAQADVQDNEVILHFSYPFHMNRCLESKNLKKIKEILHTLTGKSFEIKGTLSKKMPATETQNSDTLQSVTKVFGGGEILDE